MMILNWRKHFCLQGFHKKNQRFNPLGPEFISVIFIQYKPRIAVAILDLEWMKMIWCGLKI